MIPRQAADLARTLASQFKVLAIAGPRQSGKTTLARSVFADLPYVNLEEPDQRLFAEQDPRRFLELYGSGAVIDEAQRCPALFSYLRGWVDARPAPGQFILTGSQHVGLIEGITQSLAGRVGLLRLLPFSLDELDAAGRLPSSLDEVLWCGGYPPIYDQPVTPDLWYSAYVTSYVERDVRTVVNVRDLGVFQRFLALCASNLGQLHNASRMGADLGVTHDTVRSWLHIRRTWCTGARRPSAAARCRCCRGGGSGRWPAWCRCGRSWCSCWGGGGWARALCWRAPQRAHS